MTRALTLSVFACAACASAERTGTDVIPPNDGAVELGAEEFGFRVVPANQREPSGALRVLPQDFGPFDAEDLGPDKNLDLSSPVAVTGVVTGDSVTPYAARAGLPTESAPVVGHVEVADREGNVRFTVPTSAEGEFLVDVLPGVWEARVVPDAGSLAPDWVPFTAGDDPIRRDFFLEPKQALYGQVRVAGRPYPGADVFAVDLEGHTSGTARTDDSGRYELRVPSGTWEVTTTGVATETDPTLRAEPAVVTSQRGASVDLDYPMLSRVVADLQVTASDGSPVGSIPVRFTATSLDGYGPAEFVAEDTISGGQVVLPLLPGTYDIEIAPAEGNLRGWAATGVRVQQGVNLDSVSLEPLLPLSGHVLDSEGDALAGARVTCEEIGFAGRSWSTFADTSGQVSLALSAAASCAAVPPAERSDLAMTRATLDLTATSTWNPRLRLGIPIGGRVTIEGEPEPFAIIEVRDATGLIVGQGLSDPDGNYALALPPD